MDPMILSAVLVPLAGTGAGAAAVLFQKKRVHPKAQGILSGFAAGVMTAASIWSLLLPAIDQSASLGALAFLPACAGVWAGFAFLALLDPILGPKLPSQSGMMAFAVALHNLPEGMAVGAAAAAFLSGAPGTTAAGVLTLAIGIGLQNLPEGAIISMPLHCHGMKRIRAFGWGVLSGVIEPIGAAATILLAQWLVPALPVMLAFSAGAMLHVVVDSLIPDACCSRPKLPASAAFFLGFTLMMALDVALS